MTPLSRPHALAAFLPGSLVRALQEDTSRPRAGARREQPGALLFADLSGFTPLAESLDRRGPSGAEHLRGLLDACFSQLTTTVLAHGGDVLRFAGDALVALWPAASPEELPRAVALAARCAQTAQALFEAAPPAGPEQLRLKVGIGAGTVRLSDVGGAEGHWDFLVSGEPLREMVRAEHAARPEEIVLGPRAWALLPHARGEPRGEAGWRLVSLAPIPLPPSAPPPAPPGPELEPALRAYLPRVVSHRLDAGHEQWLSEFRSLTVLFINLGGEAFAVGERPEELHPALHAVQALLFRHGGCATQVVVDDKGVVMVAAFGLPPLSHEDDAVRAVLAALEVRAALRSRGLAYRLGLATGRVFCGATGGDTRREYVLVGHTVNLAARLMQAAEQDLLCDAATLHLAAARLRFELRPPVKVKGITQPVPVFRPQEDMPDALAGRGPRVVGRHPERAWLAAAVHALASTGVGATLRLEGEAGMGKSVLVGELLEQARARGLATARGESTPEERARAWHPWSTVLPRLLGLERLPDAAARAAHLLARLEPGSGQHAWAPLLNGLLSLQLPEGEVLRHMPAATRGSTTRELLVHLLERATRERPWVVVLDDAHWMDSASWELALAVQERVKRLVLVLALRPTPEAPEASAGAAPGLRHLRLGRMPAEDVLELVARRLGARRLGDSLASLLLERAEGHPLFSEELACALRDAGHLTLVEGEGHLAAESAGQLPTHVPGTIQALLLSRVDRLTPQQQLTLKVASVLGRAFSLELLHHIHPVEQDRASLPEQLAALERLGFLHRVEGGGEPGAAYAFQHVLVRDAAYQLMAFAQRRELHRAVALRHESAAADDEQWLPLLAHHWHQAEEPARALVPLERAALAAAARGAPRETLAFLTQALRLTAQGVWVEPLRAARWHATLAAAHRALGEWDEGMHQCDLSLARLGSPRPATRLGWAAWLLTEALRHVTQRLLPGWNRPDTLSARTLERLTLQAGLFTLISEQAFYKDRTIEQLAAHFAAVNAVERTQRRASAPQSYAALGYLAGMFRLRRQARHYFRRGGGPGRAPLLDVAEGAWHLTYGHWEKGQRRVERGIRAAQRVNDCFTHCTGLEVLGMSQEMAGPPAAALATRERMLQVARAASSAVNVLWALAEMAPSLLALSRVDEAVARLGEARALLPRADPLAVLRYHCSAALVMRRTGQDAEALAHVREALRMLGERSVVVWSDVAALGALAQAALESWAGATGPARGEARALTQDALRVLRRAGRLYPTARGRAARLEGQRAWLEGQPRRARALWRRALEHARVYRMPTDEALAHDALAHAAPAGSGARAAHHAQACRLFENLGAQGLRQTLY